MIAPRVQYRPVPWDDDTIVNARKLVRLLDAGLPVALDDDDITLVRDIAALADEFDYYPRAH